MNKSNEHSSVLDSENGENWTENYDILHKFKQLKD